MGTMVKFTIYDDRHDQALDAIAAAAVEMQRIEDMFTIYGQHENSVKQFNRAAVGTPVALPEEVELLLNRALQIEQQSGGAFSPSLAKLNLLWGFSGADTQELPPSPVSIAAVIPPKQCVVRQQEGWVRLDARCGLDFGAIAKGYAIDRAIAVIREHDISNAVVNAGGDIRLIGRHGDRPWRIGIRHPREANGVIKALELEGDVAVVTSGDYERFYLFKGERFHHILDPQTGYPSRRAQSVTVITSKAAMADAWSTALFVQGRPAGSAQLKGQMSVIYVDDQGMVDEFSF